MIRYNDMEELKLYRTNVYLPTANAQPNNTNTTSQDSISTLPTNDRTRGVMLMLCTPNIQSSIDIINNSLFKNKQIFRSYFIDYYYKYKIYNRMIFEKIDQKILYSNVKAKTTFVKITKRMLKSYKGLNTYVDLSKYNEHFDDKAKQFTVYKGDRRIKEYITLLQMINDKYVDPSYVKRIMVLDLHHYNINPKDSANFKYMNADNPYAYIMNAIKRYPLILNNLDMDILFINSNMSVKINTKNINETTFVQLKTLFMKMHEVTGEIVESKENIPIEKKAQNIKNIAKEEVINKLNDRIDPNSKTYSFTGEYGEEVEKIIDDKVNSITVETNNTEEQDVDEAQKELMDKLNKDEEFLQKIQLIRSNKSTNTDTATNLKRNKLLAEKQAKLKVKDKTLDEVLNESSDIPIEQKNLKIKTLNDNMKSLKLMNFEKSYNKNLFDKDTLAILNFFKECSVPVYILDIKKEDTSDNFSKKITYTVKMESADRERHTLKFDLPKPVDNYFLYMKGNKKSIVKQLILKPVVKTGPNTVQVCTNYNKIFMERSANKISPGLERLKKAIIEHKSGSKKLNVIEGDNSTSNLDYKTILEYDELGSTFFIIEIFKRYIFVFNQEHLKKLLIQNKISFDYNKDPDLLPVGIDYKTNKPIILDTNKGTIIGKNVSFENDLIECIAEFIPTFKSDMYDMNVGKKYAYTKAKIMAKNVPLILLLAYKEGLTSLLNRAEINVQFSDKRIQLKDDDKNNKDIIEFADGYLVFDRMPFRNSLLMNGLSLVPTKEYDYADFDNRETYLDIFDQLFGVRMLANAFDNFYDLLIDPITKEVLQDLNMPTNFIDLLLYANSLLEDKQYIKENNMSLYRIRSNEMINVYLYKALADAYSRYRLTYGNKNPVKMSIPQDSVIKTVLTSNVIEDYSTLNPIVEAEKIRATSFKGPSGREFATLY